MKRTTLEGADAIAAWFAAASRVDELPDSEAMKHDEHDLWLLDAIMNDESLHAEVQQAVRAVRSFTAALEALDADETHSRGRIIPFRR